MKAKEKHQGGARRFQLSFVLFSLAYILLGLIRILDTDPTSMLLCYILGGFALAGGVVRMAFFFLKPNAARLFRNDLAIGVLLLFAGLYCILKPESILALLPVVLGFGVLFDSVLKMEYSFHMKRAQFGAWAPLVVLALVSCLGGVLLVLNSFSGKALQYFMGGTLIYDGLLNLLTLVLLTVMLRRKGPGQKAAGLKTGRDSLLDAQPFDEPMFDSSSPAAEGEAGISMDAPE